ncbi:MAG: peptidyl-prolyl cis-trans isomerase [Clostridiales bacterium]|nr:peptidyl-prolyl cis-trans isomerase [Clostridiales bacterium]
MKKRVLLIAAILAIVAAIAVIIITNNNNSQNTQEAEATPVVKYEQEETTEATSEEAAEAPAAEEAAAEAVTEVPAQEEATEAVAEEAAEAPAAEEAAAEEATEAPAAEEAATEEATEAPAAEEAAAAPAEDPLLVKVNGDELRESDETVQFFINYYLGQVGEADDETMTLIRQYSLDNAITYRIIMQKLDEAGKKPTDEDFATQRVTLKNQWDEIITEMMSDMYGVGDDASEEDKTAARGDVLSYIQTYYGYTEESFIEEGVFSLPYDRAREVAGSGEPVTDEQVEAYFQDLVEEDKEMYGDIATYEYYTQYLGQESMYIPEGYRGITHILLEVDEDLMNNWQELQAKLEEQGAEEEETTDAVAEETAEADATPAPTEEPVTQEMVDAAKKAILDSVQGKVDEIMAKLKDGADFEELIKEYGTDSGMDDEATRAQGYPVHKDSILYDPAFIEAATALEKVGDVSDPIVTQFGVHLLYYLRDIPGGATELTDTMREEIREALQEENANEAFNTLIDGWIAGSTIEWTEAGEPWKIPEETAEETAEE